VVECSPDHWQERKARFKRGESNFDPGLKLETAVQMWPTPTQQDNPQVRGVGKATGKRGTTLGGAVRMWPTPTSSQAREEGMIKQMRAKVLAGEITQEEAEMMISGSLEPARMEPMGLLPTPDTQQWDNTAVEYDRGAESMSGISLAVFARTYPETESGGSLNPNFVEYLMGFPKSWTEAD